MAITGRFLADFSDFQAAVQKADVSLKGMETGANQVTKSLDKMVDSFSGRKIVQEATLMAQAFEHLASQGIALTSKELQKMGAVADEAIAKLKAGGQAIPPGIQKIADAAAKAKVELTGMGNAFSGKKVIEDANATVKAVADLGGAAKLTEKEMQQVNAQVTEAIAKYKALGQVAPAAMTDLAKATSTAAAPTSLLGKTMGDLGTQLKATALGFISAQAIIGGVSAAFDALVGFVNSSIKAFAGAETASKGVEAALLAQGDAVPGLADQYEDLASAFEETTGFADDLLQEMQALLITVGDVGPDQMEAALKAATDLSVGLGKDLKETTLAVAKAFEGNAAALKKMLPAMDAAAVEAGDMAAAFDAVEDAVGGRAAARMDTYAGKILDLANAWDNLQESVGKLIVSSPIIEAALNTINDAVKRGKINVDESAHSWSDFLKGFGASAGLTNAIFLLESWSTAANDASKAARAAAREMQFWVDAQADFDKSLTAPPTQSRAEKEAEANAKFAASLKTVTAAVDELSAAQKRLIDQGVAKGFNPEEIAKGLGVTAKAVENYIRAAKDATKATDDFAKAMKQAASEQLAVMAKQTADEFEGFVKAIQHYETAVVKASNTTTLNVAEMGEAYKNFGKDVASIIHRLGVIKAPSIELPNIPYIDFEGIYRGLDRVAESTKKSDAQAKAFTQSLTAMASALANLGKVSGGFGAVAKDMATLVNAIATGRTAADSMKDGLAGIGKGKTGDALLEIGTAALTMASAFMQATETGTAMQKTLKGAALGASIGKQWGLLAAAIGAAAGALAGFIRSLNATRNAVKDLAKSFGGFDELRSQLRILGDEGERLWKKFTQASTSPAEAQATAKEITKALETVPKALNDMVAAAVKAGGGLDLAMVPYIESLIEAGQLTEANKNLLLGLPAAGVPSFNEVAAAAEALGLNIDTIGESIKQLKFTDTAETLAKNLDILARAGADMDAVLNGVKGQLQDLVTDALKFGRTIPEQMRPFLQQLVDSGKLTDQFGVKLEDLESLDFAKPLEDSIADLIVAMHELVDVIVQDVGGALDDLGKKVVRPKISPDYVPAAAGPAQAPPPDLGAAEAAIREAPTTPPPGELTVIMEMDGRVAASAVVPYFPGEVQRFVAT